jgi:hypothetical protein
MAFRSNPAWIGRFDTGAASCCGVLGLDGIGVFLPVLGREIDPGFGDAFALPILGGSSSSSTAAATEALLVVPLISALLSFFWSAKGAAEGGLETGFEGVESVFFLENQPDFFCLSSSLTTIRSSVNSGSYGVRRSMGARNESKLVTSGSSK